MKVYSVFEVEAPNGVYLKKILNSFDSAQNYIDYLRIEDPNAYYMIKEIKVEEFVATGVPTNEL